MAKKGWSNIHGEVKEAKSIKTIVVVWVPGWNKTQRGKTLATLSFLFFSLIIYIYTYAFIKKQKIVECMYG